MLGAAAALALPMAARADCVHLTRSFHGPKTTPSPELLREFAPVDSSQVTDAMPMPLAPRHSPCKDGIRCGGKPSPAPSPPPPTAPGHDALIAIMRTATSANSAGAFTPPDSFYSFDPDRTIDHPPRVG
jgi:hypothetical protein